MVAARELTNARRSGNHAIIDGKWKAVTYQGRKSWENRAAWGFDDDHWELYDIEQAPSECRQMKTAPPRQ